VERVRCQCFWGNSCCHGEIGVGQQGEGDVAVPGVVAADLIVVEPDLGFRGLEAVFDRPAGAGDPDQLVVAGADRGAAQVLRGLELALGVGGQ
jgi:hypothetical protein